MNILTTISPSNIENQTLAVNSWKNLGYDVKSFNSKSDIENLSKIFDVEFIETNKLGNLEFGKDYVRLNTFTDWIKQNGDALIINSDVEIYTQIELTKENKSITIFNRNDYTENIENATIFRSGFDAFYLTPQFCQYVPESKLVLGQCHWDYYLPMVAIKYGFIIKSPKVSNLYHKKHTLQYDSEKWKMTAKIFAKELSLTGIPGLDSNSAYKKIKSKIEYYG